MARPKYSPRIENVELELLLQAVLHLRGINLQEHEGGPVRRQVWEAVKRERVQTVSGLLEKLIHQPEAMDRFVGSILPVGRPLSAQFFLKFRREVVPILRTYPFIRIWQIGCSYVPDLYLLAIILQEEGAYEKSLLYTTDLHEPRVQSCRDAVLTLAEMDRCAKVYAKSGGRDSFTDYVIPQGNGALFTPQLKKNMIFAAHNLSSDSSFNEFNAVVCREELKMLNAPTHEKISRLLTESLVPLGFLSLADRDQIRGPSAELFTLFDAELNLYRKAR